MGGGGGGGPGVLPPLPFFSLPSLSLSCFKVTNDVPKAKGGFCLSLCHCVCACHCVCDSDSGSDTGTVIKFTTVCYREQGNGYVNNLLKQKTKTKDI